MILQLIHKLFGNGHSDDCDLSVIATQAPTTKEGSQSDKHRVNKLHKSTDTLH